MRFDIYCVHILEHNNIFRIIYYYILLEVVFFFFLSAIETPSTMAISILFDMSLFVLGGGMMDFEKHGLIIIVSC